MNAKIDFVTRKLQINYNSKKTSALISIEGIQCKIIAQDFNESFDEEIDEMLEEEFSDEYENKSDLNKCKSFNIN